MNRNIGMLSQRRCTKVLETNKVLSNTYLLLGMTFIFSSIIAYLSFYFNVRPINPLLMIVGAYGLMFMTHTFKNSPIGLLCVFAFTGFIGYTLGPILNFYIGYFTNGYQLVGTALGGTGVVFFSLSGYSLITRKDFGFLNGFLFASTIISLLVMIAGVIFNVPIIQLLISAIFILISSGLILFQTSEIIYGGENNYIIATLSLFVSIYNLFVSFLNLLGAFSGKRD